jgi:prolyl-tRNA editing enzyme YbaK/EbsC (Cys-tRNA(Pro) deacylase)
MNEKLMEIDRRLTEGSIEHELIDLQHTQDTNKKFKTLILRKANGGFLAVLSSVDSKVDIKKMEAKFKTQLIFATEPEIMAVSGAEPGAVCPFDLKDVLLLIDDYALRFKRVSVGSGDVGYSLLVDPKSLMKIKGAKLTKIA